MEQVNFPSKPFTHRVLIIVGIVTVAIILLFSLGYFAHLLLLVFAGILLAVFLHGIAEWLSDHVPLSAGWSLALVIFLLLYIIGIGTWLLGPDIANNFDELTQIIPQALHQLQEFIKEHDIADRLLERFLQQDKSTLFTQEMFARVAGIFSSLLGLITGILIIFVNGIYFSAEPKVYINGAVHLFPKSQRGRARTVLSELGHALRWWLVGRIASMTVVGVLTWVGLLLLGIPSAAALALLAAALSFIPNLGPILAAVPAVLAGWLQGPMSALYVILLYMVIQAIESYLITPLIQRRTVMLPPAFILTVQLAMGIAFGILGLLLATPFAVVILVLVQMLYVEDILEEQVNLP
ncbi:AI-2E family transporter [Nitrosococcus wardiae]|uniref:AI-2E family transporter n=1 Tax=Nitrosococcus wardiae TaxID=1814290 RepID=A0A4V1AVM6_9GAMM|nr:AI-2E family transporter [Nitrosococcus wardiae]QBQ53665.1 AI-2E family transporter [Nitrosococcus wardiae]